MISEFFGAFDRSCQFHCTVQSRIFRTDSSLSSGELFNELCTTLFLRWALIVC